MSSDTKSSLVKKQKAKNDSKDFPVLQLDPEDTGLKVNILWTPSIILTFLDSCL